MLKPLLQAEEAQATASSGGQAMPAGGGTGTSQPMDASLIVVHMNAQTELLDFEDGSASNVTFQLFGPAVEGAPGDVTLALTQPIRLDRFECEGAGCHAAVSVAGRAVP